MNTLRQDTKDRLTEAIHVAYEALVKFTMVLRKK